MTNLYSILKNRNITLLTKVHIVKAMVFPVVMYRYEVWTIKKSEHWRIDAFEMWCCKRLLRVPCTERRWNHLILKEINPEYSLKGLMLKLKLQYFGPPNVKNQLTGKDPDAGQDWRQEKMGMKEDEIVLWPHWLVGYEFEHAPEVMMASEEGHTAVHGLAKIQTWLSDWNNYPTFYVLYVMIFTFLYFLINKVL